MSEETRFEDIEEEAREYMGYADPPEFDKKNKSRADRRKRILFMQSAKETRTGHYAVIISVSRTGMTTFMSIPKGRFTAHVRCAEPVQTARRRW